MTTDAARPTLLVRAFQLAEQVHSGRLWKDGKRPYLYHPLAVSSLVLRYGGDDEQAAAALVHDLIDDPRGAEAELAGLLSPETARIAHAFSDPPLPPGLASNWGEARKAYLQKLASLDRRALLVVGCEELHELGELLLDLRERPPIQVWAGYSAPRHNLGWYFREVLSTLHRTLGQDQRSPSEAALLSAFAAQVRAFMPIAFEAAGSSGGTA